MEYVLDYFGPMGAEPLLTEEDSSKAREMLLKRCNEWHRLERMGRESLLDMSEDKFTHADLNFLEKEVDAILAIIENAEPLLTYFVQVFGPQGPTYLSIEDEESWNVLDDLFLCRLPYPLEFSAKPENKSEIDRPSKYRLCFRRGERVEVLDAQAIDTEVEDACQSCTDKNEELDEQDLIKMSATTALIPEQTIDANTATFVAKDNLGNPELPGWAVVGICAAGAGCAVLGGLAMTSMIRFLMTPKGSSLASELLVSAVNAAAKTALSEVKTGPRGGKYVVTANGTKSYCVP